MSKILKSIDNVNTNSYNSLKDKFMTLEWSAEKNDLNVEKHQVSFKEAKEVF